MRVGESRRASPRMLVVEQVILRVLAAEVQRRKCPGCVRSLEQADISAHFSSEQLVKIHFRCRYCVFEGGGEIEITPEIYDEAARSAAADERLEQVATPITADELLVVHEALDAWVGDIAELLAHHAAGVDVRPLAE